MFLHLLNEAQKQVFCNVVQFIVTADGVVDDREKRILAAAQRELDLDELPQKVTSLALLANQLNVFDTEMSRRILILEAVAVAQADGEIPESEMNILNGLCECLQISQEDLDKFCDYAKRFRDLTIEGEKLVFGQE